MKKRMTLLYMMILFMLITACAQPLNTNVPSPTPVEEEPTIELSSTLTLTPTLTPAPTSTPTPTPILTLTPTPTLTSTPTPEPTLTSTPTPTLTSTPMESEEEKDLNTIIIRIGDAEMTATLENNTSAAFRELLTQGDITISMTDYGNFEKVGPLGHSIPTNDTRITTVPGDVILYQGNQITIYYDTNTWSFTRIAKISDLTQSDLISILGSGSVTATFSIE